MHLQFRITRFVCVSLCCFASLSAYAENENNKLQFDGSEAHVFKTIGDDELKIHVFQPPTPSEAPRPAIVFFFGGGWKAGSPKQFEQHCRYLAERGVVAMTADYRVSSRHGTKAKEAVQDAKSAMRWVRNHADELKIDPNRLAAGGGSAGGHLAACTATISQFDEPGESNDVSCIPNALVLYNPAVTLAPFEGNQPLSKDRVDRDGTLEERMGTKPENLSPAHNIRSDLPPTIMFFGTEDFLLDGAKFFEKEMLASGNQCELVLYDDYAHGFFNYGKHENKPFVATLIATDKFLNSLGFVDENEHVEEWLSKQ
ncbi:Carboxylesterase NlhH [Thalassoglobus neptunius]|uniref:Carboxylesterase NlhH n=1 Tax=Thalassoglobus neptunius TaxID=1938619 RepID=A0A5C5X7H4_9PLAN|nr:alpha/beta hydrolase [Thalassoglobus neptunius]TWT58738.1 Carboxylesterase NlhH [Thalassoglobus neptunius]